MNNTPICQGFSKRSLLNWQPLTCILSPLPYYTNYNVYRTRCQHISVSWTTFCISSVCWTHTCLTEAIAQGDSLLLGSTYKFPYLLTCSTDTVSTNVICTIQTSFRLDMQLCMHCVVATIEQTAVDSKDSEFWVQQQLIGVVLSLTLYHHKSYTVRTIHHACWQHGTTVSNVGRIYEVNQRRARLVLGWVTILGWRNRLGMYGTHDTPCVLVAHWRGTTVSNVGWIYEVNQRRARLVVGWVTIFVRVNHLGM